jgi:hypothetical protein
MPKENGQTILGIVASLLLLIIIVLFGISKTPLQVLPLIFLLAPVVFLITFLNTDAALILLIFSMLLSPEIKLAEVPARAVVVRIDDILLIVIFFSWLAKMAMYKQLGLLKHTPLNIPIGLFIVTCILSTGRGILVGTVAPIRAFFYILKFIEYFMLYFMFVNNIKSRKQIQTFMAVFLLTCFIITILSCIQIVSGVYRPTAPFEGEHPEPNSLAGYLLLVAAVDIGLFIHSSSSKQKFLLGTLACFILFSFIFTLSRSSYTAFIPMYLTLIIITKKRKVLLIGILMLAVILSPFIMPNAVKKRITDTFVSKKEFKVFGRNIPLEASAAARIYHWQYGMKKMRESPLFGHGITGIVFIDSQYFRFLGELGIIGFIIFVWVLMTIFRNTIWAYQVSQDTLSKGLCIGFLAGFVGLLVQAIAVNTFTIVRIMEPFWFLTAIVMRLPELTEITEPI